MKHLSKTLAVLLALLLAFGVCASAAALPDDLAALPVLTAGTPVAGTIAQRDDGYQGLSNYEVWYKFTPTQSGCYLLLATWDINVYSWLSWPQVYDAHGTALDRPYRLEQDKTYYIYIWTQVVGRPEGYAFTLSANLYTYAEPLKNQKMSITTADTVKAVLKGSKYALDDVEYYNLRGNLEWNVGQEFFRLTDLEGEPGFLDLYFKDGTYTSAEIGKFSLSELYAFGGLDALWGEVFYNLAQIPTYPILGIAFSFVFVPYTIGLSLITLLPLSVIALPIGLLFLPFTLAYYGLNLFA